MVAKASVYVHLLAQLNQIIQCLDKTIPIALAYSTSNQWTSIVISNLLYPGTAIQLRLKILDMISFIQW
jgi:hypothetical protein